jgi:hypothetical protein
MNFDVPGPEQAINPDLRMQKIRSRITVRISGMYNPDRGTFSRSDFIVIKILKTPYVVQKSLVHFLNIQKMHGLAK